MTQRTQRRAPAGCCEVDMEALVPKDGLQAYTDVHFGFAVTVTRLSLSQQYLC